MQPYLFACAARLTGIRFNDCIFSEPAPLAGWIPPPQAGLFAVLIPDRNWGPRPFQPVFFGELNGEHTHVVSADEYVSWFQASAGKDLYVAVCPMPYHAAEQRAAARDQLVLSYSPLCNRRNAGAGSLAYKLEELEKKNQEQTALLRLMFAAVGRLLEPPPQPRARTFGFQPPQQGSGGDSPAAY